MGKYDVQIETLRSWFDPKNVSQQIEIMPPINTWCMDTFIPEANRTTLNSVVVGRRHLTEVIKNGPVTRRGTAAYPISVGKKGISFSEIQNVSFSERIGADELNNDKVLSSITDMDSVDRWGQGIVDHLRKKTRATAEALSIQAIFQGKISYWMKDESGVSDLYEIDYTGGAGITEIDPVMEWGNANIKLSSLVKDMTNMEEDIEDTSGYGASYKIVAGKDAFALAADMVSALPNDKRSEAVFSKDEIILPGFSIERAKGGYTNLETGAFVKSVDPKYIYMIATDAPIKMFYCAIDDLDAGLNATPLFFKTLKHDNPSSLEIISQSKPVPVPVPQAVRKMNVVDAP